MKVPCSLLYLTALLIFRVLSSQPFITPPSPTVKHNNAYPWKFITLRKALDKKREKKMCPLILRLLPCWEETLVTVGTSDTMEESEKEESQLGILCEESYRRTIFKTLQQMLHEMAIRGLPSHLLSNWDAAFLPLPCLPRAVSPLKRKDRQNMSENPWKQCLFSPYW